MKTALHPSVIKGLRHFNAGEYFLAHEDLEAAWRDETVPLRRLYQGILQVGVALYHLERGNNVGALKSIRHARANLVTFPDEVLGINVEHIKADAARLEAYLAAGDWSAMPPGVRAILLKGANNL